MKAIGGVFPAGLDFREIEIQPGDTGRPRVNLSGAALELADGNGIVEVDVSLTHAAGLALAHAVAVRRLKPGQTASNRIS